MARTKRAKIAAAGARGAVVADVALRRLASGALARRDAGGGWRLDGHALAPGAIDELARAELVAVVGDEARATDVGVAHVDRADAGERPNRWLERAGTAGRAALLRDRLESPLAWLVRRRLISPVQFAAGERLRGDWQLAHTPPAVTMRWEASVSGRGGAGATPGDPTSAMIDARTRIAAALAAAGPGMGCVLERVVCLGEGLATAERAMGWPARAGKVVLGLALDRLAQHYRIDSRPGAAG